jgi:hypothetical protein
MQVSNEAKRIAEHDPLSEDMIHEHDETSGGSMCTPAHVPLAAHFLVRHCRPAEDACNQGKMPPAGGLNPSMLPHCR